MPHARIEDGGLRMGSPPCGAIKREQEGVSSTIARKPASPRQPRSLRKHDPFHKINFRRP